jgi:hypothetical protein
MGDRRPYLGLLLLGGDREGTIHDGHWDVLLRVSVGQLGPRHRHHGSSENPATATECRPPNGYAASSRLKISGASEPSGPGAPQRRYRSSRFPIGGVTGGGGRGCEC